MIRLKRNKITSPKQSYIEYSSDAGIAKVNVATKELIIKHDDISVGSNSYQIEIQHIYSNNNHVVETYCGNDWKLNITQYLIPYESTLGLAEYEIGDYVYIDSEGYLVRFVKHAEGRYHDVTGRGLSLTITSTQKIIENIVEEKLYFDSEGKLISMVSVIESIQQISKVIEYEGSKPVKIYDQRKESRYIEFKYNQANKLEKMSLKNEEKEIETIYYKYEIDNLKAMYHFKNGALAKVTMYKYDVYNNLCFGSGTNSGIALSFSYTDEYLEVKKGIAKIKESNLNTVGVQIGKNYLKTKIGNFLIEEEDGLLYLADEYSLQIMEENEEIEAAFELLNMSAAEAFELTTYEYTPLKTYISSAKGINYEYNLNEKGYTTGCFEIGANGELYTLTKDSGVALMEDTSAPYSINGKPIEAHNVNELVLLKGGSGTISDKFKEYVEKNGRTLANFTVSFWLNHRIVNPQYIKAKINVRHVEVRNSSVYVDHIASNVWQYVSIPIQLNVDHLNYDIASIQLQLETKGSGTYQISDVRIEEAVNSKLRFYYTDFYNPNISISEFYSVVVVKSNNQREEIILDEKNFLSESDFFNNCKNMKKSNVFEFVYSASSKVIGNVTSILVRPYKEITYRLNQSEFILGIERLQYVEESADRKTLIKRTYNMDTNYIYETIEGTLENNYVSQKTATTYQGLIQEKVDTNHKKTVYEYDRYGNILTQTIALESDFDNTNNVIKDKLRLQTSYSYNDDTNRGYFREMIVGVNEEEKGTSIKKSTTMLNTIDSIKVGKNYEQEYKYDILNRLSSISIINNYKQVVGNRYIYNVEGRLASVSENETYEYTFDYDKYGNISSYNLQKGNERTLLVSKSITKNPLNIGEDISIQTNHLTNTTVTTIINKYGQVIRSEFNDKVVEFRYQGHKEALNTNKFSPKLSESPSIAKIKTISDPFDNSITEILYENRNDESGYVQRINEEETLLVQQIDSLNTKYGFMNKKYKTSIKKDKNVLEPKIISSKIYFDDLDDNKDKWEEQKEYSFNYEYDPIMGAVKKKYNNLAQMEVSYNPNNGSRYYENKPTSLETKYDEIRYKFDYYYDINNNLIKIKNKNGTTEAGYTYDKINRLKTEVNPKMGLTSVYSYANSKGVDLNRVTKIVDIGNLAKEYKYDELNRLVEYYEAGSLVKTIEYDGNNLLAKSVTSTQKNNLIWSRNNLLTVYGSTIYEYNYQGVRVGKNVNGSKTKYYYDGSKLLGESRANNTKIRYMYDLTGISGASYTNAQNITKNYNYLVDALGNVIAIVRNDVETMLNTDGEVVAVFNVGKLVSEYQYDAWGNVKEIIIDQTDDFAKINPIKWKGQYYDDESKMYYINGRYYDSKLCQYLDCGDIESIISNANYIGGLNLNAICNDNPVDVIGNISNIMTSTPLQPDPTYDPLAGFSWWDKNWHKFVVPAIVLGITIVMILNPATSTLGIGMLTAGIGSAIGGMVVGGVIGGIAKAINGGNFLDGVLDGAVSGFLDGFTYGAILYCLGSIANTLISKVKAPNKALPKPGRCFIAGTLIACEEGLKAIEDIRVDDQVWSWNEETNEKSLKKVTNLFTNLTTKWTLVEVGNETIKCTSNHPFLIQDVNEKTPIVEFEDYESKNRYGSFVEAKDLTSGMKVLLSNGRTDIILSVKDEELNTLETTYNFEVEDFHTYYVGEEGILVHNDCISDELTKIASKYGNEQCVEAADDMVRFLDRKGLSHERVNIQYSGIHGRNYVVSDTLGGTISISSNGYHTGIRYGKLVFDNIHTTGISYGSWVGDFAGLGKVSYYSGFRMPM